MRSTAVCLILLILSVILAGCSSEANKPTSAQKAGLIPGTEDPIIKECDSGTAYIYKNYEIHVEPSPELEGMNIFLYSPEVSKGNPCGLDRKNASHIIGTGETIGSNYFEGIYGYYLFIDQGTGPDMRILTVYDLSLRKLVLLTEYSDPELKDGILTYYKTLVPTPGTMAAIPCPDKDKWEQEGFTILYEQKESFTLSTETRIPVEGYRCRAGQ